MSDYERTMELVNTAYDSQGRSSQQFAKYADSVEYSVKRLSNTWEQFRVNLANNDLYKGLIDTANNFLEKISDFNAWDWSKLLLMFSTVGYRSIQSFLTGSQKAISSVGPAITKNLVNKIPKDLNNMSFAQKAIFQPSQRKLNQRIDELSSREQEQYKKQINNLESEIESLNKQNEEYIKNAVNSTNLTEEQNKNLAEQGAIINENVVARNKAIAQLKAESKIAKDTAKERLGGQAFLDVSTDPATLQAQFATVGASAGAAFTAAFTTAMMTDDPSTVFTSTLISGATAAVPGIVNTFTTELARESGTIGTAFAAAGKGGLVAAAVTVGIALLASGYKALNKYLEENNEKILETTDSYYRATKKLEELEEEQKELGNKAYKSSTQAEKSSEAYQNLADKAEQLEKLRSKILLTTEESAELVTVSNEIANIAPELVSHYDAEGNAVIQLTDSYKELIKQKKEDMLTDRLIADEDARNSARNALETAIENKNEAESLYNSIHAPSSVIDSIIKWMGMGYEFSVGFGSKDRLDTGTGTASLGKVSQRALGARIKEITKNNPYFDALQNFEDIDVYTEYRKLAIDFPETRNEFVKSLESITNNFSQLDKAVQDATDAFIQAEKNYLDTKLLKESDIYASQTDKNVQDLMQKWILSTNNITEDSIREQFEQRTDWTADQRESQEYQDAFSEFIKTYFDNIELDDEALKNVFTTEIISVISQLNNLDLNIPEKYNYAYSKLNSAGLFDLWANDSERTAWNNRMKEIERILDISVPTSPQTGLKISSNSLFNSVLGARNAEAFVEKLNTWANADRQSDFLKIIAGWSGEDLAKVFEINWSEIAAYEYNEQLDALSKLVKSKSKEEIESLVSSLNLFDYIAASEEDYKEQLDERFKYLDKYDKKIKAIQTAGDSWAKDGKVSASGIEALYDAGIKVSDLVGEDLQFNLEAAKELVTEELEAELKFLETQQSVTKEYIRQLELISLMKRSYSAQDLKLMGISPEYIERFFTKKGEVYTQNEVAVGNTLREQRQIEANREQEEAATRSRIKALNQEWLSVYKGINDTAEDSAQKRIDAEKAVQKAYEDVLAKQQDVIDKQKELNKVLYGDEYHKNKLDALYNYNTALDVFNERIQDAKDNLDNLQGQNPAEFFDAWLNGTHGKASNLQATNERYNAAINSIQAMLNGRLVNYLQGLGRGVSSNVADYYRYNEGLDRYEINYNQLNLAQMNDQLKDFIEEQVDLMNQHKKNIKKNQDELKNLEKEFKEYQKKLRDDYISVQESIAKTLEEYYKKEVEDKKEMYEALEEADNKYLDALQKAIDRERKLRDTQDKWNDLATKEKRLSLLQRDTSGANTKTVQSLRKEIEKDRRSMLDSAVDTVVENLKELYETQKETREIELQYQEALLENSNYIAEANQLLESWKTIDEMRDWMWAHTEDINKMSDQAVEKLTEDWADMFDTVQAYNEATQRDITSIFNVSAAEVQNIVFTTSEVLTSEAARAFGEVSTSVNDAIANAEKAVSDAINALADAQQNYNEKLAEFNQLVNEFVGKTSGTYTPPPVSQEILDAWEELGPPSTEPLNSYVKTTYPDIYNQIEEEGYKITKLTDYNTLGIAKEFKEGGYITAKDSSNVYIFKDDDAYYDYIKQDPMHRSTIKKYRAGGLASYTGPAWVDGTPSRPEAFLNAEDTARIGEAANIFASLASLGTNGTLSSGLSQTIGDTNAQINIYVESIATPDQVDYLINRMKEEIVDTANPIGTSVILHQ